MKTIELSQGYKAIIDDEDYERVSKYKWYVVKRKITHTKYAQRSVVGKIILLHRFIMGANKYDVVVDHKNGDGLDCRKSNMRLCSRSDNQKNKCVSKNSSTGYKGVTIPRGRVKYMAKIRVNNKHIYLGLFESAELAAVAYNNAALKYHGEYARLNKVSQ